MLGPPLRAALGTSPLTGSLTPTPAHNIITQSDYYKILFLLLSLLLDIPAKESRSAMRLDLTLRSRGASLWMKKMTKTKVDVTHVCYNVLHAHCTRVSPSLKYPYLDVVLRQRRFQKPTSREVPTVYAS